MGEIKKRLPLKCPACDAPLREIHFGPAPNPVWLVLCGRASDCVAVVPYVDKSFFMDKIKKRMQKSLVGALTSSSMLY